MTFSQALLSSSHKCTRRPADVQAQEKVHRWLFSSLNLTLSISSSDRFLFAILVLATPKNYANKCLLNFSLPKPKNVLVAMFSNSLCLVSAFLCAMEEKLHTQSE